MLPRCGMLFLVRFMPLPHWPPSESSSNLPVHQSIPTLAWIIPLVCSVVLDPCYAPGYRNFDVCFFVLFRLRVLLFGEIKPYKRIRIPDIWTLKQCHFTSWDISLNGKVVFIKFSDHLRSRFDCKILRFEVRKIYRSHI